MSGRNMVAMAAIGSSPFVSVEEYLARFVDGGEEPICEYVDGELVPKAMGTKGHSQVQANKWGVPYCWVIDPERRTAWDISRRIWSRVK